MLHETTTYLKQRKLNTEVLLFSKQCYSLEFKFNDWTPLFKSVIMNCRHSGAFVLQFLI